MARSPLAALRAENLKCQACGLAETRNKLVFGDGNPKADILLLGEGPGKEEDRTGKVFVGESGGLLDDLLGAAGMKRADLFISNSIRCRAFSPAGKDRKPSKSEMASCLPWLHKLIYTIDPIVIVAAGETPMKALTNKFRTVTAGRKDIFDVEIPGQRTTLQYPVMVMFHPAALLRRANNFDLFEETVDQLRFVKKVVETYKKLGRDEVVPTTTDE